MSSGQPFNPSVWSDTEMFVPGVLRRGLPELSAGSLGGIITIGKKPRLIQKICDAALLFQHPTSDCVYPNNGLLGFSHRRIQSAN